MSIPNTSTSDMETFKKIIADLSNKQIVLKEKENENTSDYNDNENKNIVNDLSNKFNTVFSKISKIKLDKSEKTRNIKQQPWQPLPFTLKELNIEEKKFELKIFQFNNETDIKQLKKKLAQLKTDNEEQELHHFLNENQQRTEFLFNRIDNLFQQLMILYTLYHYFYSKCRDWFTYYQKEKQHYIKLYKTYGKVYLDNIDYNTQESIVSYGKNLLNVIKIFYKYNHNLNNCLEERSNLIYEIENVYRQFENDNFEEKLISIFRKHDIRETKQLQKRVVKNNCIEKTLKDAQHQGFPWTTLYTLPNFWITKQCNLYQCIKEYDWPFICKNGKKYVQWNSKISFNDIINSYAEFERKKHPYIGKITKQILEQHVSESFKIISDNIKNSDTK